MYFCIIIMKDEPQAMLERIMWHLFSFLREDFTVCP